uniref:hypothetical protein n=1 Tax=Prevotella sp. TaxID=59823 RepID=UPI0040265C32
PMGYFISVCLFPFPLRRYEEIGIQANLTAEKWKNKFAVYALWIFCVFSHQRIVIPITVMAITIPQTNTTRHVKTNTKRGKPHGFASLCVFMV